MPLCQPWHMVYQGKSGSLLFYCLSAMETPEKSDMDATSGITRYAGRRSPLHDRSTRKWFLVLRLSCAFAILTCCQKMKGCDLDHTYQGMRLPMSPCSDYKPEDKFWLRRDCLGCPDVIEGYNYTGTTMAGAPFVALNWQDCCALCQLTEGCAAWVYVAASTTEDSGACWLRTNIIGLTMTPSTARQTITGAVGLWTPPRVPQPPPPPIPPTIIPPPPPPPPDSPRYCGNLEA
jgi:hypothetical protein